MDEFAFLFPAPRSVRLLGGELDSRSLSFPLEVSKRYGFLFEHFRLRGGSRGLEVVLQERRDLAGDAYAIDAGPERIVLSAGTARARFFALSTWLQIQSAAAARGRVPAFALRDAPAFTLRGFLLPAEPGGEWPGEPDAVRGGGGLPGLLLRLALLKFSHFALPAHAVLPERGAGTLEALAALAGKMGVELFIVDEDPRSLFRLGRASGSPPGAPILFSGTGQWWEFFLDQHRRSRERGERLAAWGDAFLGHPEWIRKLPRDVLVLNRGLSLERGGAFRAAVLPFRRHHVPQALCPVLCERDRFLPDARAGLARVGAACAAAAKGEGVLLAGCEPGSCGCPPQGAAMLHFQAGCLLWGGRLPGPGAFSRWAVGSDEPDLFRVYSFLAQAEHRLPHSHCRYLFEDPILAPFSRQGDPKEVEAHYRKAALYLRKRRIGGGEQPRIILFARKMYDLIAAKVGFSARLGRMLGEARGGEEVRLLVAGLERGIRELKGLYGELRCGPAAASDPGSGLDEFDSLGGRLAALRRQASSPSGCAALLRELRGRAAEDL